MEYGSSKVDEILTNRVHPMWKFSVQCGSLQHVHLCCGFVADFPHLSSMGKSKSTADFASN